MEFLFRLSPEALHYGASLLILSLACACLRFAVDLVQWWDGEPVEELSAEDQLDWKENNP